MHALRPDHVLCIICLSVRVLDHQLAMGHQVWFGLLGLAAPLVYLGSASAAAWSSSQFHFSATVSQKPSIPRHFEAYIINDLETNSCAHVSFGVTQHHKELARALDRGDLYHTERSTFGSGRGRRAGKLERIRVFSNDTQVLRDYYVTLCGLGDHRTGEGITINKVTQGDVPTLEIRSIFQSGDPNNRADLVFFSDGCKWLK